MLLVLGDMPARVMPTPSYMNPVGKDSPDPSGGKQPKQQMSDLTLCLSLCSLFDFDKSGRIGQEDWQRGMTTLMLEELGFDQKIWTKMTEMHGVRDGGKAMIDVNRLTDIVPIDPRVAVLLNAIVKGLVGMREFVSRSLRKETKEGELKLNRAVINMRRRITQPVLLAWKELVRSHVPHHALLSPCREPTFRAGIPTTAFACDVHLVRLPCSTR